jgi:hypothetical protein
MPEGFGKFVSVLAGAVLAIFGLFNIPSAVLTNSWGNFVIYTVLMILGFWILSWALRE